MRLPRAAALLALVMLAGACGGPGGGPGGDDGGDPGGGPGPQEPSLAGTLVSAGSRWVQTRDLSREGWTQRVEYEPSYALPVAHVQGGTLYMARFTMADPFHLDAHDLTTFDLVVERAVEWPGTELAHGMTGLALSPDGSHVAGVLEDVAGTYLEVLALRGAEPASLLEGFRDVTGHDLLWLNDATLAFAMDLGHVTDPEVAHLAGALVAIDLSGLMAGGPPGEVPVEVLVGFEASDWASVDGVHGVGGFAVARDRSRLAYTYGGDLWILDLNDRDAGPEQLTRGPFPHQGAAFSPDGGALAFVEYVRERTSSAHIIPITTPRPLLIDSDRAEGRGYLLGRVGAQGILAWLP